MRIIRQQTDSLIYRCPVFMKDLLVHPNEGTCLHILLLNDETKAPVNLLVKLNYI